MKEDLDLSADDDDVPTSESGRKAVPSIVPEKRIMAPQNRDIQQQHLLSLRARYFYASRYSRLCYERKRQLKQIESLVACFLLLILSQPTTWYQATG